MPPGCSRAGDTLFELPAIERKSNDPRFHTDSGFTAAMTPFKLKRWYSLLPLLAWIGCCLCGCTGSDGEETLSQAEQLLIRGKSVEADHLLQSIPENSPVHSDALLARARIAIRRRMYSEALPLLEQIPRDSSRTSMTAAGLALDIQFRDCSLSAAAELCRYLLENEDDNPARKSMLATILAVGGKREQSESLLLEMLFAGNLNIKDLVMLTSRERLPPESDRLFSCSDYQGTDPLTLYALANRSLEQGDRKKALQRLMTGAAQTPEAVPVQSLLGELLLDEPGGSQLRSWASALPETIRKEPEITLIFGLLARRLQRTELAASCFISVIKADPLNRRAIFQLARVLADSNPTAAAVLQNRADRMLRYSELMERVLNRAGADAAGFSELLEILVESGRPAEAAAWVKMDNNRHGLDTLNPETSRAISQWNPRSGKRFDAAAFLDRQLNLAEQDSPKWSALLALADEAESPRTSPTATHSAVIMSDQAQAAGLNFTYRAGGVRAGAVRIFESTGGGTAAFDLDVDGRPDLIFTQGEPWPDGSLKPAADRALRDRLYRGTRSGFRDISTVALPDDDDYGQGVSAADFNNDGFPDLYIAAIGGNRLLLNNGDGTLQDVTKESGLHWEDWTTSCLIMDLTGDSVPDLFDVNYLTGDDVFLVECGETRCSVLAFQGAPDRLMVGTGDGRFLPAAEIPVDTPPKGLGISVLPETSAERPTVFIANDQVPNFLLVPNSLSDFQNEASLRGIAVNANGRPTACMGVAARDLDADGRTDLFVTNFEGEANCLYLQRLPGLFEDAVQGTGLQLPGIPWVGWGTQAVDLQNNGLPDLVVANGHVADFRTPDIQSAMPLQLFRNLGGLQFETIVSKETGEILNSEHLGRSVAILDWNCDGQQDFAVSCIDTPAILATNMGSDNGNWLKLKLIGVEQPRDCSGIRIRCTQGSRTTWHHVSSGDGFQATNERLVHIGLGDAKTVDTLEFHWSNEQIAVFRNIAASQSMAVIEGRESCFSLPD